MGHDAGRCGQDRRGVERHGPDHGAGPRRGTHARTGHAEDLAAGDDDAGTGSFDGCGHGVEPAQIGRGVVDGAKRKLPHVVHGGDGMARALEALEDLLDRHAPHGGVERHLPHAGERRLERLLGALVDLRRDLLGDRLGGRPHELTDASGRLPEGRRLLVQIFAEALVGAPVVRVLDRVPHPT